MVESVIPVAVAPVALPGPQTRPSVPKLPVSAACAWPDFVLEPAAEDEDDEEPQAPRARLTRTATTALIVVLVLERAECTAPP
jgi:hypothetical protein